MFNSHRNLFFLTIFWILLFNAIPEVSQYYLRNGNGLPNIFIRIIDNVAGFILVGHPLVIDSPLAGLLEPVRPQLTSIMKYLPNGTILLLIPVTSMLIFSFMKVKETKESYVEFINTWPLRITIFVFAAIVCCHIAYIQKAII